MRLMCRARVTTAQSIITKVNRSPYVTIGISPFLHCVQRLNIALPVPWVSISLSMYYFDLRSHKGSDGWQFNLPPLVAWLATPGGFYLLIYNELKIGVKPYVIFIVYFNSFPVNGNFQAKITIHLFSSSNTSI